MKRLNYKNLTLCLVFLIASGFLLFPVAGFAATDIRLDTDAPGAADSLDPCIASDDNGNVYSVWVDTRNESTDIYLTYSRDHGNSWLENDILLFQTDEPGKFGPYTSRNPDIKCDDRGNVYVVWGYHYFAPFSSTGQIYLQHSSDYGVTWQEEPTEINGPLWRSHDGSSHAGYAQLYLDGKGHVYVCWNHNRLLYFRRSLDYGQTWQDVMRIETSSPYGMFYQNVGFNPQMSCDSNGHIYIVWKHVFTGDIKISYSLDYGVTWEHSTVSSEVVMPASDRFRMASDESGHVYVAWRDKRNENYYSYEDIYFNYSEDYGATWQAEDIRIDVDDPMVTDSEDPRISCDNDGNVYLVWNRTWYQNRGSYRFSTIQFRSSHNHGATWAELIRLDTNPYAGNAGYPRIDSDDNGVVYATYTRNQRIHLNYSLDYGRTWLEEDMPISDAVMGFVKEPKMTSDEGGDIYVVWRDNRNLKYDIYFNYRRINIPPRFNPIGDKETYIGRYLFFPVSAYDPNGDEIQYGVENLPEGARFIPMNKWLYGWMKRRYPNLSYPCYRFYWRPRGNQAGEYNVTFWVQDLDEEGGPKTRIQEKITITVKRPPNRPPRVSYIRNYRNFYVYWRGYDTEDKYKIWYSYKIDSGEWSSWTRRNYLFLRYISWRAKLKKGGHVFQVKARDKEGLESRTRAAQFYVR